MTRNFIRITLDLFFSRHSGEYLVSCYSRCALLQTPKSISNVLLRPARLWDRDKLAGIYLYTFGKHCRQQSMVHRKTLLPAGLK
jgi:hypothetical protein